MTNELKNLRRKKGFFSIFSYDFRQNDFEKIIPLFTVYAAGRFAEMCF